MNRTLVSGIVVLLLLVAGGSLWYFTQPSALPSQVGWEEERPEAPSTAVIETSIVGSWKSVDDPKFVRSFEIGGRVTDRYDGTTNTSGHYELDGDRIPAQVKAVAGNSPVLSIEFPEETLFFLVTKLTAQELELIYIGGSGSLRFTRI